MLMERSRAAEVLADVIPITGLRRVERIDGFKVPLGTMPYDELLEVYVHCQNRAELANAETDLVAVYLDERFPAPPAA